MFTPVKFDASDFKKRDTENTSARMKYSARLHASEAAAGGEQTPVNRRGRFIRV